MSLNEIGEISRGKSRHRPRNAPHLYGGKYPLIQTGDIQAADFYINSYTQTYSDAGLAQSKLWTKGTLCISIVGSNTAATAILGFDACFPDSVIGFNSYKDISNTKFVKYCLELLRVHMKSISEGAARENLSLEKLLTVKLPIPSLETQTRIANILSAYDDLIENNLRRIKLLEEMAELTYREWFVNFTIDGKTLEIDKNTGLPFGWERRKFSEIYSINNGCAFESKDYRPNGIQILRTRDYSTTKFISYSESVFLPNDFYEIYSKYRIQEYDLMLIMVGASIGNYGIVLKKDFPALQNQNQWAIREKKGYEELKLYKLVYAPYFIKELLSKRTGAARDFFRASFLNEQLITIPTFQVIERLNEIISPIFNQINNLSHQNRLLKESRDILLPRLMSGEIGV